LSVGSPSLSDVPQQPTVIDLFAGCGGMTAGFVRQGFRPVLSVEWNLHAAATYAANFGESHTVWGDIAELPDGKIPRADVVIGGPPCQGFSNLGSKDVHDPRNKLWQQYLRVVQRARPKIFVIENVDRFRSSAEFALLTAETQGGMIAGYTLTHGLLLAADYGVAQRRMRTIVIGSRVGPVELPVPTHSRNAVDGLLPWRTVRDRISDEQRFPRRPRTTDLPSSTAEFFGRPVPGVFKSRELHFGRRPRELSLLRYDAVPPGGGRFDLPDELLPRCWRDKPSGTTDVMGRMRWDAPSLTIRTEFFKPEKGQYLHPQWDPRRPARRVNRVITHSEAAALQDFDEDFVWCGSKVEIAKQIGNAVPVGLAEAVARRVRAALPGRSFAKSD
jgi:DNA (cytosine-5)-methyltransferase 1